MKIIIYDNDKKFLSGLKETISFIGRKYNKMLRVVLSTSDGEKILSEITKAKYEMFEPYLFIINPDIDGVEDGIELAKKIRKINSMFYIVFVSSDDYIRKTLDYDIRAFNYFFKPVGNGELTKLIENVEKDFSTMRNNIYYSGEKITLTVNYKKILLPLDTIIACEYKRPKTFIYTTNGCVSGYFSLTDLQEKLDEAAKDNYFIKTHKAISINLKNAIEMDSANSQITTIGDYTFPVARGRKKEVREKFNNLKSL